MPKPRKTVPLSVRFAKDERRLLEKMARAVDRKPSSYLRWLFLREAGAAQQDASAA